MAWHSRDVMKRNSAEWRLQDSIYKGNEKGVMKALREGADLNGINFNTCPLTMCILYGRHKCATIILQYLSEVRDIIMDITQLNIDLSSLILEFFGNVQKQIQFCWIKITELGWTQKDLQLAQLLIYNANKGSDYRKRLLLNAIKRNMSNSGICLYLID